MSTSYVSTERLSFYGDSKRSSDFFQLFFYWKYCLFIRRFDLTKSKNGRENNLFLSEMFFVNVLRSVNDLLILAAFSEYTTI